jgi:hypothetical protein
MGGAQVILVDTHVVVWLAFEQGQLSKNARAATNKARQNGEGFRHMLYTARFSEDPKNKS